MKGEGVEVSPARTPWRQGGGVGVAPETGNAITQRLPAGLGPRVKVEAPPKFLETVSLGVATAHGLVVFVLF